MSNISTPDTKPKQKIKIVLELEMEIPANWKVVSDDPTSPPFACLFIDDQYYLPEVAWFRHAPEERYGVWVPTTPLESAKFEEISGESIEVSVL